MAVELKEPIVIPATEAKTFAEAWLVNVRAHAPSLTNGSARLEILPFNAATGEIGSGKNVRILETDELWLAVSQVPEFKTAMDALVACINPMEDFLERRKLEIEAQKQTNNS